MNSKIPRLMNDRAGLRGLLRTWLCCAAFYYPFFWISVFLVQAAPALIRVPFRGFHLEFFEISYGGTFARSVPRSALDFQHAHP
ncbi:MAG TPA: hypothetical protein VFZ08_15795, partial [Terriglobia bacterium]|nr:hypothetical protein [Terriglobia bacterium]